MHARTTWLVLYLSTALASPVAAQITPGTEPGTFVGPSSSQTPYAIPTAPGWSTIAVISVGDQASKNAYRMVGIPDGLGAIAGRFKDGRDGDDRDGRDGDDKDGRYADKEKYMTVFMNHEIGGTLGVTRDHGQTGAFVSQWTIRLDSLNVRRGEDLIQNLYVWDTLTSQYLLANGTLAAQLSRLCSADLPAARAFYNPLTHKGFNGTKVATEVLRSDPARFTPLAPPAPGATPPFNQDEESSGIIEVTRIVRHAKWADE